jgi:hypothetical protein
MAVVEAAEHSELEFARFVARRLLSAFHNLGKTWFPNASRSWDRTANAVHTYLWIQLEIMLSTSCIVVDGATDRKFLISSSLNSLSDTELFDVKGLLIRSENFVV